MSFDFNKYSKRKPEDKNEWLYKLETYEDYLNALEKCFSIKSEAGGKIPFKLRRAQKRLLKTYVEARQAGKGIRIVHLKARQYGGSTLIQSLMVLDAIRHPDSSLLTVAHETTSSAHIMDDMALFMIDTMCNKIGIKVKKRRYRPNMQLTLSNRAKLESATAKNLNLGRSKTFRFLHLSEVAFWWRTLHTFKAADDIFQSVLGTLPEATEVPDATVILESTGYGRQGAFYEYYRDAKEGKSNWIPFFVPWYEIEKYELPVLPEEEENAEIFVELMEELTNDPDANPVHLIRRLGITKEEVSLIRQASIPITWGQILWRRQKLNDFRGDIDRFNQEYPATADDAFSATGIPAFNPQSLIWYEQRIQKGPGYRLFENIKDNIIEESDTGFLRVWEEPDPKGKYVVSADVAAGNSAHKFSAVTASYSAAEVFRIDQEQITQVAEYMARPDPIEFGGILFAIASWYNTALLVPERNADGFSTINEILHLNYHNLYARNVDTADPMRIVYGIQTDVKTKKMMLNAMRYMVAHRQVVIRSMRLIQQMYTVNYTPDGRIIMPQDADLVMATMIGLVAVQEERIVQVNSPDDDDNGGLIWDPELGLVYS